MKSCACIVKAPGPRAASTDACATTVVLAASRRTTRPHCAHEFAVSIFCPGLQCSLTCGCRCSRLGWLHGGGCCSMDTSQGYTEAANRKTERYKNVHKCCTHDRHQQYIP